MSAIAPAPLPIDHAGVCSLLRRRLELARKHNRETQVRHDRAAPVRRQQEHAETQKLFAQVLQNERQANGKKKTAKKNGEGGQSDRRVSTSSDTASFSRSEGAMNTCEVFDIAPQSSSAPADLVFNFDEGAMKKAMSVSQGYSPHSIASMAHPSSAPLPGQYPAMSSATPLRGFDQAAGFPSLQVDQQSQVLQGQGSMQAGLQHVQASFQVGSKISQVSDGNPMVARGPMSVSGHSSQGATSMQPVSSRLHANNQVSSWEPNALGGTAFTGHSAPQHLSHMGMNDESDRRQCAPAPSACYDMTANQSRTLAHDTSRSAMYSPSERSPKTHTWPRMNGPDMTNHSRPLAQQLSDFDEVMWQVQNSDSNWPGQDVQPVVSSGIDQSQHIAKGTAYYEQSTAASSRLSQQSTAASSRLSHMPAEVNQPMAMGAHKPLQYVSQPCEPSQAHQRSFYSNYSSGPSVPHGHSQGHSQPSGHHGNTPVVQYRPIHTQDSAGQPPSYSQQWNMSQGTPSSQTAFGNRIQAQTHRPGQVAALASHADHRLPGGQQSPHMSLDNQLPHRQLQANPAPGMNIQQTAMATPASYSSQQHALSQSYPQQEQNPMLSGPFPMNNTRLGQMPMDVGVDNFLPTGQQPDFANMLTNM